MLREKEALFILLYSYRRMLATLRILGRGIGESEFTTDGDRLGKRRAADRGQDGGVL